MHQLYVLCFLLGSANFSIAQSKTDSLWAIWNDARKDVMRFNLPDDVLEKYKIAPLALQLLVENAVKHNRMSVKEPLVVEVSLGDDETLIVKNRLQLRPTPSASTGLGLQNIINRNALLTARPVWAGESEEAFIVKLPLL
ncbi:MAG: hypothetical protein KF734_19675 [Saprospiraceae bacterium]|nr:hypothetical protein [Saprospiraceae bacterium]